MMDEALGRCFETLTLEVCNRDQNSCQCCYDFGRKSITITRQLCHCFLVLLTASNLDLGTLHIQLVAKFVSLV